MKNITVVHIGFGVCVQMLKSFNRQYSTIVPERIGKYVLVDAITKDNAYSNYAIGVYKYKKDKYVIKTWTGRIPDYDYFDLLNEYTLTQAMKKVLHKSTIAVPQVVELREGKNLLSLVTKYIAGKKLSELSEKEQIHSLVQILTTLHAVSDKKNKALETIPQRGYWSYLLLTPVLYVFTLLSHPQQYKAVTQGFINFLRELPTLSKEKLYLAHRDINLHNAIKNGKTIILLDCSKVARTFEDYDVTYISIDPAFKKIIKRITTTMKKKSRNVLSNFILIHQARSIGNHPNYDNIYIRQLQLQYR